MIVYAVGVGRNIPEAMEQACMRLDREAEREQLVVTQVDHCVTRLHDSEDRSRWRRPDRDEWAVTMSGACFPAGPPQWPQDQEEEEYP